MATRCAIHEGPPITLQATRPLEISSDGTITQDGVVAGKLEIVDFTSTAGLSKQGSNYFELPTRRCVPRLRPEPAWNRASWKPPIPGSAEGAVRLVSVMRQFEMLQKAVSLGAEMNKQAIEEVAKV